MPNHESDPDQTGIREPSDRFTPASAPPVAADGTAAAESQPATCPESAPATLDKRDERDGRGEAGVETPSHGETLPAAWQPLTFRGVAAFAHARIGRVCAVQLIVALAVAAAIGWFLHHAWFPRVLEAIRALPPTGVVEHRALSTPLQSVEPLAADSFLSLSVRPDGGAGAGAASDLRIEFRRLDVQVCWLLGCRTFEYPAGYLIQFNQPELESWWGAWRGTVIAAVAAGVILLLFVTWILLATAYAIPVWLAGFFQDRRLSPVGSWKLASAALLAPACFMAVGIVLYGLGLVDLLRLLLLWVLHLPAGWIYLAGAVARVPKKPDAAQLRARNPFGDASARIKPARAPKNPFAS